MKYFVDTSFLVAYSNDRDKDHQLAIKKMKVIKKEEFLSCSHQTMSLMNF